MMKILHIAVHMGGGIASAYAGLGSCGQEQHILLLEQPIDYDALSKVERAGFCVFADPTYDRLDEELRWADVVVFSWYHHPALTKLLHDFPAVPIRSVLWSHVFGSYFPHITTSFVKRFDQVAFTTPLSLEMPQIRRLGDVYMEEHLNVVCGLNDLTRFAKVQRTKGSQFVVGYVGTLNFFKLHPDFIRFCAAVDVPNVRFLIVGAPTTKTELLASAAQVGIADRFEFCGQLQDVTQALARMDVFGYPLNPEHSGTTENALLEAMASGLPAVALDQCVERHIIKDGATGFLVRSPEEYGKAIRVLYDHREQADAMGVRAQADIMQRFDIQVNRRRFLLTCERAMQAGKKIHRFDDFLGNEPADWFLSCVHEDRSCFEENRAGDAGYFFHEHTKGSPIHYHAYFPEDQRLALWSKQLLGSEEQKI